MVKLPEDEVFNALLKYAGEKGKVKVGDTNVKITIDPEDIHKEDRPDCILWLKFRIELFTKEFKVEVPIPVEAEAEGMSAAQEDLDAFIEREHYPLRIPMLIVASHGYGRDERSEKLPTKITLKQIPERLLHNDCE